MWDKVNYTWSRIPTSAKLFGAAAGAMAGLYALTRTKRKGKRHLEKTQQVHAAGIIGGALSMGLHMAGKGGPGMRAAVFLGATYGVGTTVDLLRGQGSSALATNALSVAVGAGTYFATMDMADKGLQALKQSALLNKRAADGLTALTAAFEKASAVHPIFANFLSKETLGIGAAMVAIPIANHIIQRAIQSWQRRPGHERHVAHQGSDHEAGGTGGQKAPTIMGVPQQHEPATVNINGQVRTKYAHEAAMRLAR